MPRPNAKRIGEVIHTSGIQEAFLDEVHGAANCRGGPKPGRTAGRGFRSAAQARPEASTFCCGGRWVEGDVG